jgi:hypothetical protein
MGCESRVLSGEGETIEWSEDAYPYTSVMADEDTVLEEAMDNLKEAGGGRAHSITVESQEDVQRPWWRRMFGG